MMNSKFRVTVASLLVSLAVFLIGLSISIPIAAQTQLVSAQGSGWIVVSSPVTTTLNSIAMVSPTDGWAVGNGGAILRWNGSTWATITSPVTSNIKSVSAVSSNDAWAVSDSTVLRWNGSAWATIGGAPSLPFQAVDADATNAWLVGGFAVCAPVCNDFNGFISHWNGSSWSTVFTSHKYLYSIAMTGSDNGWAVGDLFSISQPYPTIVRWNGSSWMDANHPVAKLYGVSALSPTSAWAVGIDSSFSCTTQKWDGNTWAQITCPPGASARSVAMVADNDVWAVGGNTIIHWDGNTWAQVTNPVTSTLRSIAMVSANDGWIVGDNGVILRYGPPAKVYLPLILK